MWAIRRLIGVDDQALLSADRQQLIRCSLNDSLLQFLLGLAVERAFTAEGIDADIERNKKVYLFGDLTRDAFAEKVWFVPNIAGLPIGHLADHRMRMTERVMTVFLRAPNHRIERLLWRMLCVAPHTEAGTIIAGALGLNVPAIAQTLIKLRADYPPLFRACVGGYIGDACNLTAARKWPKAEQAAAHCCVSDMLLFHSMLQVQLIAARARSLESWRYGESGIKPPMIASDIIGDMERLIKAYSYYASKRDFGRYPRQRPPLLADHRLMVRALRIFGASGRSRMDVRDDLVGSAPIMDVAVAKGQGALDELAQTKKNWFDGELPIGLRQHGSTMFEHVEAGIQLAFAVLRLINLRDHRRKLIRPTDSGRRIAFCSWSKVKLPMRNHADSEKILFVIRAVLLRDAMAGQAFDGDGKPTALLPQLQTYHDAGKTAGEDLFKSAKESWPGTDFRNRTIVAGEVDASALEGVQRLDVLPDYLLQLKTVSSPRIREPASRKKRHGSKTVQRPRYQIVKRSRKSPTGRRQH